MKAIKNRFINSFPLFLKVSTLILLIIFCFLKVKNKDIRNSCLLILAMIDIALLSFDIYKRKMEIRMLRLIGISKISIILEIFLEYLLIIFVSSLIGIIIVCINNLYNYSMLIFMLILYVLSLITILISTNYLLSKKKEEVMIDE